MKELVFSYNNKYLPVSWLGLGSLLPQPLRLLRLAQGIIPIAPRLLDPFGKLFGDLCARCAPPGDHDIPWGEGEGGGACGFVWNKHGLCSPQYALHPISLGPHERHAAAIHSWWCLHWRRSTAWG